VLSRIGDQKPVIPLIEILGSGDKKSPEHIGLIGSKIGVVFGITVMVSFTGVPHCPKLGVKLYSVVEVLFKAGDHAPEIPFVDVVERGSSIAPAHIGLIGINDGVSIVLIFKVKVVADAHCPTLGIKV
jgi:hypothetical protein